MFKRAVAVEYLQTGVPRTEIAMKYGLPNVQLVSTWVSNCLTPLEIQTKCVELHTVKCGVMQALPQTEKLDGVAVAHPVLYGKARVIAVTVAGNIGQRYILVAVILGVDAYIDSFHVQYIVFYFTHCLVLCFKFISIVVGSAVIWQFLSPSYSARYLLFRFDSYLRLSFSILQK